MKKTVLGLIALGATLSACGTSSSGSGPSSGSAVAANTCLVSNPNGSLPNGSTVMVVALDPQRLQMQTTTIYSSGNIPTNVRGMQVGNQLNREEVIRNSTGYSWSIGPAGDGGHLNLVKNVIDGQNSQVYQVDQRAFADGQAVSVADQDFGINLQCNIPGGWSQRPNRGGGVGNGFGNGRGNGDGDDNSGGNRGEGRGHHSRHEEIIE